MTGALLGWAMGLASSASAQSFLDKKYRTPPGAPDKGPAPNPTPKPTAEDGVPLPSPEPEGAAEPTERTADGSADAGVEPEASALEALPAADSGPVTEEGHGPSLSASLRAATAYADRGLNAFGRTQSDPAGMLSPSVELSAGRWSFGWAGVFQSWGPNSAALVREGVGAAQEASAAVAWSHGPVDLEAEVVAIAYPFASNGLGTAVEPGLSATLDLGVDLTAAIVQSQAVDPDLAGDNYAYAALGLAGEVGLSERAALELSANGGAKAWNRAPSVRPNTWDVDLAAGLELGSGRLTLDPSIHLAWTNLAGPLVAGGFVWGCLDARFD